MPIDRDLKNDFFSAIKAGDVIAISGALGVAPDLSRATTAHGDTALLLAAYRGHTEVARVLIEAGADVNARNTRTNTVLHEAASNGHNDLVTLLLEHGAEIDAFDEYEFTPLVGTAMQVDSRLDTCILLLDRGADLEGAGGTFSPLCAAATTEEPVLVQFFLDRGASVEGSPGIESPVRPLYSAAASVFPNVSIMAILVSAGADVNGIGQDGSVNGGLVTALHGAAEHGNVEAARYVLEAGADIEARDDRGRTPLRRMVERRLLLIPEDRVEVPLRDFEARTLELLVEHAADLEAPDHDGITPLGYCLRPESSTPFAELLRTLGARN